MTKYLIFIIATIIIAAFICFIIIYNYRAKSKSTMQQIIKLLNDAILGKQDDIKYDESMESAISNKLNQYINITKENNRKITKEKESIKSLVSDIAHQTKTPLSNIILLTQLTLETEDIPEESRKMITDVNSQAEKLSSLINILVKTSYLEGGLIQVEPKHGPLLKIILEACSEIKAVADKKNITIEIEEQNSKAKYDYKWTREALLNILDNAVKYSQPNTTIRINIIELELFTRVDISDQGMGIDEAELAQIFTRFYRSPRVHDIEGVGVGLYLAREIMSMQGGYIKVSSVNNTGSVFSVYFPK